MGSIRKLVCIFLLPVTFAVVIDRYHTRRHSAESTPNRVKRSTGNAGIWDDTDWHKVADDELAEAIRVADSINRNKAKNVIMFIGDGMGVSTVSTARLYHAESRQKKKQDIYLSWEKFPHIGLSRTYNVDKSTPDSAGTATAYLCGVKANMETIGVSDKVKFGDCAAVTNETKVRSIVKESIAAGKWTGLISTARITHASPAGGYAHVADRDWETYMPSNPDLTSNQTLCDDIARQLIEDPENTQIRVILGGGLRNFLPNDINPDYNNVRGYREDGRNLVDEWIAKHNDSTSKFVLNNTDFSAVDPENIDYLLGLFTASHMAYEADRDPQKEPSLAEMTEKAIRILQRSPEGYFLFVEGGRIDHSHHDGIAFKALNDTVAMADAVQRAAELTDDKDTLIVVTADHSHVFTFGGYGSFHQSIFDVTDSGYADDGKPFLQIHYGNGPGFYPHRTNGGNISLEQPRLNLSDISDIFVKNFAQDAAVPLDSETHGGEDVAIFARGPMSHLFHGVHEQHYIARVMMYASCVGRNPGSHCSPSVSYGISIIRHQSLGWILAVTAAVLAIEMR